jgi:DNA replication and repair protein RecF
MHLEQLSLSNFRNFARLDLPVPKGAILVAGRNAQGKTSLLEAIYFLATLSSFHAENDRQLVNFIEARKPLAVARIQASYQRAGRQHQLEVRIIKEQTRNGVDRARKEILLDGAKKKRAEVIGHFNAVLFLPQMLQIVDGSPSFRRRYLDLALAQSQPGYAETLSEYESIVSQRNALLKQLSEGKGDKDQLEFWDERLSQRGAQVLHARFQAIQELDELAGKLHQSLTQGKEVLRLDYRPAYDPLPSPDNQMQLIAAPRDRSGLSLEAIQKGLLSALIAQRAEHIARRITTIGPHRDELRFLGNGVDLGSFGSRGQIRTTLLSLKLAELDWMHARTGHKAILLLDEVMAELDESRRADLLSHSTSYEQMLITTADITDFNEGFVGAAQLWTVEDGRLKSQSG